MIENEYVAILQHDVLKIKHPLKKDTTVELKRIIATKSFNITDSNNNIVVSVKKYDIGGFVESINNLDESIPVWVDHSARVFDDAKLLENSYMRNNALLYGSAKAIHSELANHCRVSGNSIVKDSHILDLSEVKDNAIITNSILKNNCKVYKNANISNSTLLVAATAHGDCQINNSKIKDICEIRGTAIVSGCTYSGRVIRESGEFNNEVVERDLKLTYHEEVDEDFHKHYNV